MKLNLITIIGSSLVLALVVGPFAGGLILPEIAQAAPQNNKVELAKPVNINQAGLAELTQIKGIGPKTAEKILSYRKEHGPFRSVDDLAQIQGIGGKKLEKIKTQVTL